MHDDDHDEDEHEKRTKLKDHDVNDEEKAYQTNFIFAFSSFCLFSQRENIIINKFVQDNLVEDMVHLR